MDEVESELGIHVRPLSWPINSGERFKGVYNIFQSTLDLYTPNKTQVTESLRFDDVTDPQIAQLVGEQDAMKLQEDLEMIEGVYNPFSHEEYLAGDLAPVFFGSALNTFGVKELLECFVQIAPSPRAVEAVERKVEPMEEEKHEQKDKHVELTCFLTGCHTVIECGHAMTDLHVESHRHTQEDGREKKK